jgi:hypothetical protein
MKHTLNELLSIVYRFYPHAKSYDDVGPDEERLKAFRDTEDLIAARRQAGSKEPYEQWRAMLGRLQARFPERVIRNHSLHLPTGSYDACYISRLDLPPLVGENSREIGFLVSFLVPYYVVYSSRITHLDPYDLANQWQSIRQQISFTFTADEEPYLKEISAEIEATYSGYEPMPLDVGNVIVPDVFVGNQSLGEGTLFHCLFTDAW